MTNFTRCGLIPHAGHFKADISSGAKKMQTKPLRECRREIANVVTGAARSAGFAERSAPQSNPRYPIKRRVEMGHRLAGTLQFVKEREIWAVEVSTVTFGFLSDRELMNHTTGWVDLRELGGPNAIVEIRVRKCVPMAGSIYRCVGEFLETPKGAESSDIFSA